MPSPVPLRAALIDLTSTTAPCTGHGKNPADQLVTPIIMQHLTGNPGSAPANQL
jgi:hypothetical protein